MSASEISWCDFTWNPIVGCSIPTIEVDGKTRARPGCAHCYACKDSPHRFAAKYDREGVIVLRGKTKREGLTFVPRTPDGKSLGNGAQWTGEIRCLPWMLDVPLRRRKPTTWFVNSLSDIFHETLVDSEDGRRFIAAIFGVMAACPQHTFQLLTKRPHKAREWFAWIDDGYKDSSGEAASWYPFGVECARYGIGTNDTMRRAVASHHRHSNRERDKYWPLPNVWIGTSVEDQAAADWAIPHLLETPAAVRFLSVEPMLGPVDLLRPGAIEHVVDGDPRIDPLATVGTAGLVDWVICGGESGPGARPMHPQWARHLRDQCVAAGVPFHFKQWGAWGWGDQLPDETIRVIDAGDSPEILDQRQPIRVGKKAAGRLLDGRTWDEMPG